jgi:hypothetical protein
MTAILIKIGLMMFALIWSFSAGVGFVVHKAAGRSLAGEGISALMALLAGISAVSI